MLIFIQFTPSISSGNEVHVHHLLIYVCDGLDGLDLQAEQGPCNSINSTIQSCLGGLLIGGWAVGGEVSDYCQ